MRRRWALRRIGQRGQLDLIAALEWVRDNIASFGGIRARRRSSASRAAPADRDAHGHAGGQGLFHPASLQSGAQHAAIPKAVAQARTETVLTDLGLKPTKIDELDRMPARRLLQASVGVWITFSPLVDGRTLPHLPFSRARPTGRRRPC